MLKNKKILLMILLVLLLIFLPNMVKAAVEYTRTIPSNDGTIKINFTGLTLDEAKEYEFALVRQGGTPTDWFNIDDGYTTTKASVTLNSGNSKLVEVLERTNTGYMYIREKISKTNVLENYKVNLKLPYLKAINYDYDGVGKEYSINKTYKNCGAKYYWDASYYKIEKITDSKLIETFLKNNKQTDALESLLPEPPDAGYSKDGIVEMKNRTDGLYIIWIRLIAQDNYAKTITGAIIHDGLPNATTSKEYGVKESNIELIGISLPSTKQLTLGKTITLTPTFNPSNATNKIVTWSSSDKTVATVDNAGKVTGKKIGSAIITVTSQEGNKKASCTVTVVNQSTKPETSALKEIKIEKVANKVDYKVGEKFDKTGMVIKAIYEDGTSKQVENYTITPSTALKLSDTKITIAYTENGVTKEAVHKIRVVNSNGNTEGGNGNGDDDSIAKGTMPYTGGTFFVIITVMGIAAVAIYVYKRNNDLKGI